MATSSQLKVTSHVGRDLLSSAAVFKTEEAVVWEYVVNGLQYVDSGTSPKVQVEVDQANRKIQISDNGAGMSKEDLAHFFTMHGENRERMTGRAGRGKFGTGKSAAFGIGNTLTVDTVRSGLRNTALLTRKMVESSGGKDIPVKWEVQNESTDESNGTIITIDDILLTRIKTAPIIEYLERHLQAFRALSPQVAVNNHVCEYREPEVEETYTFRPSEAQQETLGETELTIKVARAPLQEVEQGIAITAGVGNLVAIEKAGMAGKEFGGHLFGEIDVPALESYQTQIAPYDATRSLQLNPKHPVVAVLLGFLGSKLEQVRRKLVEKAKDAKRTEQVRRLEAEARKISDMLNEDFAKIHQRLQEIRSAFARPGVTAANFGDSRKGGESGEEFVRGTFRPGRVIKGGRGKAGSGARGREAPRVTSRGEADEKGPDTVDPAGGGDGRRKPRGGFHVEYRHLGENQERSRYDSGTLTILINLDHPVVKAALTRGSVEDAAFRRLSYEIAFTEYAMGLGYEITKQDPNIPADDLLYEVRASLNRVAAGAAALYA